MIRVSNGTESLAKLSEQMICSLFGMEDGVIPGFAGTSRLESVRTEKVLTTGGSKCGEDGARTRMPVSRRCDDSTVP